MEEIDHWLEAFRDMIWGPPVLLLLLGTGLYLTVLLKGMQFRYLGYAIRQVFAAQKKGSKGDISHFEALMTSLAGAIGTGSIVGVATAVSVGGLGAMFWMWVTAFLGMATKYAESLLAVKYRTEDEAGSMCGGPMQYMEKGLKWKKIALLFAFFGVLASIGTGNLVQVNSIADVTVSVFDVSPWAVGIFLALLTGAVTLGGVKSIGQVAGVLVPFMALFYLLGGFFILVRFFEYIPEAFYLIIKGAFMPQAALGGFAGATIMTAIQMGVARSVFSNEAGLGISSIAAAAAKTDAPGRQAMINMTGALMSTVIVCTMTGLVLGIYELASSHQIQIAPIASNSNLVVNVFANSIPGGEFIVMVGVILFAFSTVIAWGYYGEKCCEYIFGVKSVKFFRILFTLLVIPGAALKMETAWYLADITNAFMVIPNTIALICLSKVIRKETDLFLTQIKKEGG